MAFENHQVFSYKFMRHSEDGTNYSYWPVITYIYSVSAGPDFSASKNSKFELHQFVADYKSGGDHYSFTSKGPSASDVFSSADSLTWIRTTTTDVDVLVVSGLYYDSQSDSMFSAWYIYVEDNSPRLEYTVEIFGSTSF